MSVEDLSEDEKAALFVGRAVLQQYRNAPLDPDAQKMLGAFLRCLEFWLSPGELALVGHVAGIDFDDDERRQARLEFLTNVALPTKFRPH